MMTLSPEPYTDEELRNMSLFQLAKIRDNASDWKHALRTDCREYLEYLALEGQCQRILDERIEAAERELRDENGNWRQ